MQIEDYEAQRFVENRTLPISFRKTINSLFIKAKKPHKIIASTLSILKVNNVKVRTLVLRDVRRRCQSSERLPPAVDGNKKEAHRQTFCREKDFGPHSSIWMSPSIPPSELRESCEIGGRKNR